MQGNASRGYILRKQCFNLALQFHNRMFAVNVTRATAYVPRMTLCSRLQTPGLWHLYLCSQATASGSDWGWGVVRSPGCQVPARLCSSCPMGRCHIHSASLVCPPLLYKKVLKNKINEPLPNKILAYCAMSLQNCS